MFLGVDETSTIRKPPETESLRQSIVDIREIFGDVRGRLDVVEREPMSRYTHTNCDAKYNINVSKDSRRKWGEKERIHIRMLPSVSVDYLRSYAGGRGSLFAM